MSSDLEGISRLKLMYLECDNPDRKAKILEKINKLKTWEHPRVTQKLSELRFRKIINW